MLATDTPTTLLAVAMTHYELPGLGLDGRNVDLVQIDAPFRSYLTSARALLRARSLEGLVGNWDRSDGLPPVLRPRLASGLLRVTRVSLARFYFHEDLVTEERVQLVHDIYMRNYGYADKRGRAVSYSVEASNTNLSYKGKHITEWAGELQMPVLLMWSEPGSKIEWGVAHFFRIPGAEMHLFPWSGHHLFADQRDRWLQVVTSWLNNEPARRPNVAR